MDALRAFCWLACRLARCLQTVPLFAPRQRPAIMDALRAFCWLACRLARCLQTASLFASRQRPAKGGGENGVNEFLIHDTGQVLNMCVAGVVGVIWVCAYGRFTIPTRIR